ncbi:MAG: NTP transferase domain-containing protein [Reichenbachiella sp.]
MSKKHQKHAKISRPTIGEFGRNEFAFMGTPCGEIKKLAKVLCDKLSNKYQVAYVDADHKSGDDPANLEGSSLTFGNQIGYTDKIDFHRFDMLNNLDDFQKKSIFNTQDLVLVNGNHFKAKEQFIIIDPKKSLEKKIDKLTNVSLIVLQKGVTDIPKFIRDHLKDIDDIPVVNIEDTNTIFDFITSRIQKSTPKVKGLVLTGGKSVRMERDKTLINYHGKSQREYMIDLLTDLTDSTYYSIRSDQAKEFEDKNSISDVFLGLGPYGAILSAMMKDPDSAWLVTAADQPFLTKEVLKLLLDGRNPSKTATAFYNPETGFPEPLVTLWEPRAYPIMLQFLSQGYSCPRKVLINSDIELLKLEDASVLSNVNTPQEYAQAKEVLNH